MKFVKAIACADHNPIASKDDVDRAFRYVDEKIRFLATIGADDSGLSQDPRTVRVSARLVSNLAKIKTSTFRSGDYVKLLGPFQDDKAKKSARQVATRDLDRLSGERMIQRVG